MVGEHRLKLSSREPTVFNCSSVIPVCVPQAAILEAARQHGLGAEGGAGDEDFLESSEETPAGGGSHQPQ